MRVSDSITFAIPLPEQPTPLQQWRSDQQAALLAARRQRVELDTALFESSPLRERIAKARHDLVYDFKPLGVQQGRISEIATPAYSRGSYTLVADPGLQIQVDLGPLLCNRVSRGSLLSAVA